MNSIYSKQLPPLVLEQSVEFSPQISEAIQKSLTKIHEEAIQSIKLIASYNLPKTSTYYATIQNCAKITKEIDDFARLLLTAEDLTSEDIKTIENRKKELELLKKELKFNGAFILQAKKGIKKTDKLITKLLDITRRVIQYHENFKPLEERLEAFRDKWETNPLDAAEHFHSLLLRISKFDRKAEIYIHRFESPLSVIKLTDVHSNQMKSLNFEIDAWMVDCEEELESQTKHLQYLLSHKDSKERKKAQLQIAALTIYIQKILDPFLKNSDPTHCSQAENLKNILIAANEKLETLGTFNAHGLKYGSYEWKKLASSRPPIPQGLLSRAISYLNPLEYIPAKWRPTSAQAINAFFLALVVGNEAVGIIQRVQQAANMKNEADKLQKKAFEVVPKETVQRIDSEAALIRTILERGLTKVNIKKLTKRYPETLSTLGAEAAKFGIQLTEDSNEILWAASIQTSDLMQKHKIPYAKYDQVRNERFIALTNDGIDRAVQDHIIARMFASSSESNPFKNRWSSLWPNPQRIQPKTNAHVTTQEGLFENDFEIGAKAFKENFFPVSKVDEGILRKPYLLGLTNFFKVLQAQKSDEQLFHSESSKIVTNFKDLLIENPKYALELLSDPKFKLYKDLIVKAKPQRYDLTLKKDKYLAKVMTLLLADPNANRAAFGDYLFSILQLDLPKSALAIAKGAGNACKKLDALNEALKWDSIASFEKLFELWKNNPDTSQEIMIDIAAKLRAPKCLTYLVSHYGINTVNKERIAKEAASQGHADVALAVCNNNPVELFQILSPEFLPLDNPSKVKDLETYFLGIFRFTPLGKAEQLYQAFTKQLEGSQEKIFSETYQKAKQHFLKIAPYIARYKRPSDMESIQEFYSDKIKGDILTKDLNYAESNQKMVESLLKDLDSGKSEPSESQFSSLPKSSQGTQRAAMLLEKISLYRYDKQLERKDFENAGYIMMHNHLYALRNVRGEREFQGETPVAGRYKFAMPLVNSVAEFSKTPKNGNTYGLFYNNDIVVRVNYTPLQQLLHSTFFTQILKHGRSPVDTTWKAIEDAFESLMAFDLSKPKGQDRLTEFYSKAAELVWLIGTTQPLGNGSGTFAEWMLAIVHLKHGMNPPILKTDFPQLDVLDITFPLSEYQKFFPYFFEQSTIPEHLRKPDSEESLLAQMEKLYSTL